MQVGADDKEVHGRSAEGLFIEGIQLFRHLVVAEILAVEVAGAQQIAEAGVALVVAIFGVIADDTADLVRLVVHAVEGAGRYTVDSRNLDASLHEDVEHARGKLPAEAAALQNERDLAGVLCLIFCSHIDLLRLRFGFLLPSFGMEGA